MSATRIVTDLNGRIVEAGDEAGALLGIHERWLEGKPLAAFVAKEQVREFRLLLLDLGHGHGPIGAGVRLQRRDGTGVDVELEAAVEADGDRVEWLFVAAPEDEREQPAIAAPFKAIPLRRMFSRLPLGVISFDAALVVEYVNPAGRVFLRGAREGALLPEPFPRFSLRKFAQRMFTSTPPVRQIVDTSGGRLLEIDGIAGDRGESGVLMVQDVTARERRRRAEQEFAANAAHELRTPIAAIVSALDVLEGGAKEVPADRDRFLAHIQHESARLTQLVGGLLLLARIQTGQEQPSLQLVDAAPMLQDIASSLVPQEGVEVRVDCPRQVAMLTDENLLRQAVWNLAANAARHTAQGEIRLSGRDLGSMAEIEVRDTGSGIDEAVRPHVFDRFYRAQRRGGELGFGLGLPISQEIARALGGSMLLDSKLGVGTRVRVHVPSARVVA